MGRPPTRIEKAKVSHLFKSLKSKADPPPVAVGKASAPQPIVVNIASNDDKLVYKDYLDQTAKGSFNLLTTGELANMRRRYEDITGAPVLAEARPSDEQLSAMTHRVRPQESGHRCPPFAEFAVFGPYDGRTAKLRTFHAHVLTREGTWAYKLLSGPQTFSAWTTAWRVYSATLIMAGLAKPGQLEIYERSIGRLYGMFPNEWPSIVAVEEEVRAERWSRLYQEVLEGTMCPPTGVSLEQFKQKMPWGMLLAEMRFGYLQGPLADWWREREVSLERGIRQKPGAVNVGAAPLGAAVVPPPLPGHQGHQQGQQNNGGEANPHIQRKPRQRNPTPKQYGGYGAGSKGAKGKGHFCSHWSELALWFEARRPGT